MSEIFTVWRDKKSLKRMLISGIVFLAVATPFRMLFSLIPGVTEVRPANTLPVVFGILWGPAGAWGTAIANTCSDIFTAHASFRLWGPGFIINFFYSYLPYKLWYSSRDKDDQVMAPTLESVAQIIKYIYVCFLDSMVVTVCLGLLFEALGFQSFKDSVILLFFNNFDFAVVLGVPMILLMTNLRFIDIWEPANYTDSGGKPKLRISDWLLYGTAAGGVLYLAAGKQGDVTLSAGADWFFLALMFAVLLSCLAKPVYPLRRQKESEKLAGMSIRAKVMVGFLMLSVTFIIIIGAAVWMFSSENGQNRWNLWQNIYTMMGVAINFLFVVSVVFLRYVEKSITGPLELLSSVAGQFACFDHKDVGNSRIFIEAFCPAKTGDEIEKLSGSFKEMMTDITDYVENLQVITAEKERISAELEIATQIQADMLPRIFPAFPDREEFDIYASMNPAREVGGDFYDFFLVDDSHLAVVIADVSGKGVPAALFMVIAKTLIKNHAQFGSDPADIFTITNNQLCEGNEAGLFVTAWLGVLNLFTGEFIYVNAGHNPPLLKQAGGDFEYLKSPAGFVLAGIEDIRYTQRNTRLSKGDRLILYTDGVTEAENKDQEEYGNDRLRETVNRQKDSDAKTLVTEICRSVAEFADGARQFDDITVMSLVFEGNSRKA